MLLHIGKFGNLDRKKHVYERTLSRRRKSIMHDITNAFDGTCPSKFSCYIGGTLKSVGLWLESVWYDIFRYFLLNRLNILWQYSLA